MLNLRIVGMHLVSPAQAINVCVGRIGAKLNRQSASLEDGQILSHIPGFSCQTFFYFSKTGGFDT